MHKACPLLDLRIYWAFRVFRLRSFTWAACPTLTFLLWQDTCAGADVFWPFRAGWIGQLTYHRHWLRPSLANICFRFRILLLPLPPPLLLQMTWLITVTVTITTMSVSVWLLGYMFFDTSVEETAGLFPWPLLLSQQSWPYWSPSREGSQCPAWLTPLLPMILQSVSQKIGHWYPHQRKFRRPHRDQDFPVHWELELRPLASNSYVQWIEEESLENVCTCVSVWTSNFMFGCRSKANSCGFVLESTVYSSFVHSWAKKEKQLLSWECCVVQEPLLPLGRQPVQIT